MSHALAIAGVSAVLKDLLDSGLIDHRVTDAVGAAVLVSTLAPDMIPIEGDRAVPRLNLFLHQVTLNAAWRNAELPSRDANGRRTTNPPLALDQLQFGKAQQVTGVVDAFGGALPGKLVVLAQEGRQLECLQMMGEQELGRVGHETTPLSRSMYDLAEVVATLTRGR